MSPAPSRPHDHDALRPDEIDALVPTFVATRDDVAIAEQANIEAATRWAFGRRRVAEPHVLMSVEFADDLHRRMFGDVWRWAGEHSPDRTVTGVLPDRIRPRLESAFKNAHYWHDHQLGTPEERAVRLHDALVKIRPYRVGNRRHARFLADLYLHVAGRQRLSWSLDPDGTAGISGAEVATETSAASRADLNALQAALDQVAASRNQKRSPTQP